MPTARVTIKGQVTIPKEVRRLLGIRAGDQVIFIPSGSQAIVQRVPVASAKDLRGALPASRPYPGREALVEEAEQMAADEAMPRAASKATKKSKA